MSIFLKVKKLRLRSSSPALDLWEAQRNLERGDFIEVRKTHNFGSVDNDKKDVLHGGKVTKTHFVGIFRAAGCVIVE